MTPRKPSGHLSFHNCGSFGYFASLVAGLGLSSCWRRSKQNLHKYVVLQIITLTTNAFTILIKFDNSIFNRDRKLHDNTSNTLPGRRAETECYMPRPTRQKAEHNIERDKLRSVFGFSSTTLFNTVVPSRAHDPHQDEWCLYMQSQKTGWVT